MANLDKVFRTLRREKKRVTEAERITTSSGIRSVTYKILFSPHAVRQYKKLDPSIKSSIRAGIEALQHAPLTGPKGKRLKGRLHT